MTHTPSSAGEPPADDDERARALLAAIVTFSEDAIVSKTLESIVTSWNAAAERVFGYTAEEMIGQSIIKIIPEDLHYQEEEILARLRRGERIERFEATRLHKDGTKLDISLTISPVLDLRGNVIGVAKIAHDVTARRAAERALAQRETELAALAAEREHFLASERSARSEAERLSHIKDEFLATLSHELRTPLNAIQGWTHLLLQGSFKPEEYRRAFETIDRNVRVQAQIVNDLLDMSRIISGKVHLEIEPLYLHEVVTNAVETIRPTASAKGIRISTMLDSRIGLVRGDPARLQQVLWNLLTNAVKFTPKDGHVQVILERVNSHAEISVEDSGLGIRADFLPHVFDRFRQADPATTRRFGGLGLGLSIVKNLIELHGGGVRVKSAGENLGSTFIVNLPISHIHAETRKVREPFEDATTARDATELPRLDNVRVLVVDDEADGRALIARILEDRGAKPTCVATADEALKALAAEQFNALLSDIGMPDMDGLQLIRKVRALDRFRSGPLPAIAITAYARPEDRQRSLIAGFHMHLSKPLDIRELIASLAGLVNLSR